VNDANATCAAQRELAPRSIRATSAHREALRQVVQRHGDSHEEPASHRATDISTRHGARLSRGSRTRGARGFPAEWSPSQTPQPPLPRCGAPPRGASPAPSAPRPAPGSGCPRRLTRLRHPRAAPRSCAPQPWTRTVTQPRRRLAK
jgi:hypothetical protein